MRRVLLMSDYGAEPLWSPDGQVEIGLDAVPLSEETKDALRTWAGRYDALAENGYEWRDRAALDAFEVEGRALWARLRDELGAGWEVGYFSELEQRKLWPLAA